MSVKTLLAESTQRALPLVRRLPTDAEPLTATLDYTNHGYMLSSPEEQYRTTLRIGMSWFAQPDPDQVRHARRIAEDAIMEAIYGEIRGRLARLRNAVYQRDVQEAMYQIDKIEEVTRFDSLS